MSKFIFDRGDTVSRLYRVMHLKGEFIQWEFESLRRTPQGKLMKVSTLVDHYDRTHILGLTDEDRQKAQVKLA